ncbi:MAG: DUF3291 domain-containing protein [Anaerolineae bacterium]
MAHHIAQINIGRILGPMDSAVMQDFADNLDPINALADHAPGFVWRLQSSEGNATSIKVYDDDMLLINMSVWESIEALHKYVYNTQHVEFVRRRKEWFERLSTPIVALWWVPATHIPTPQEAKERLEFLTEHGATPYAFTFKERFTVEEMLKYQMLEPLGG